MKIKDSRSEPGHPIENPVENLQPVRELDILRNLRLLYGHSKHSHTEKFGIEMSSIALRSLSIQNIAIHSQDCESTPRSINSPKILPFPG